jgi:hypothetical protein
MQSGYTMPQLAQIAEQDMHYVTLLGYGFTKVTVGWVKGSEFASAIKEQWDLIINSGASPEEAEDEIYDFIKANRP